MSMFGIVALAGVVINDSLVLVDVINRERREGSPLMEAISKAGISRFRPIILTSITTFAGLTPLLLEQSPQAQMLIPMAVSLAFGVMFGTFITLILVPVIYYSQEDIKRVFKRMISKEESEVELEEIQINM
jgi:multidrug efflux pump subunit AcrB